MKFQVFLHQRLLLQRSVNYFVTVIATVILFLTYFPPPFFFVFFLSFDRFLVCGQGVHLLQVLLHQRQWEQQLLPRLPP